MPTRTAVPLNIVTWVRENPTAQRIGNAKVLNTAHPRAGARAQASRDSSTRQRANGKPTQMQIASTAKSQSKTSGEDGMSPHPNPPPLAGEGMGGGYASPKSAYVIPMTRRKSGKPDKSSRNVTRS